MSAINALLLGKTCVVDQTKKNVAKTALQQQSATTLVLTASFLNIIGKPAPDYQIILDFAAVGG